MSKPQLQYFAVRGRGEPVRLALAAAGEEWEEVPVDYAQMKQDLQAFAFGQAPRYIDGEVDIVQSNTIVRHLGRRHGLYGGSRAEAAAIDQLLDGVEDLRRKYLELIYKDQLAPEAKAAYWAAHCDAGSVHGRNGGAHFAYLSNLLKRNAGGAAYAVGGALSIADIMLFDIVDLHLRIFGEEFPTAFPELTALHGRVGALPGVKAYLDSPRRPERVNGNNLG